MSEFFVHEKALCESQTIGNGTRIWAFAQVMKNVVIGDDCNIGGHAFVESGVTIGNRVTIKNGVAVWHGVNIEDDVFLGPNCVLTNDLVPRSRIYHSEDIPTFLKKGCSIGANATIVCGTTIGEYAMVAAGAVVTKDVPAFGLVMGVPAKVAYFISKAGDKLVFNTEGIAVDKQGVKYMLGNNSQVSIIEEA
jgi:acetyltransferase-like isoleucine patch superfamily enzyme